MPEPFEIISTKEQYYNLNQYKDEIASFVKQKYIQLDVLSRMEQTYNDLRKVIDLGGTNSKELRYPHAAEMYKVYKSALISSNLSGYSALFVVLPYTAQDELLAPKVKKVMTDQLRSMGFIEKISKKPLKDWFLKGECIAMLKLKRNIEEYRFKETLIDTETNEPVVNFKIKEFVNYDNLDIDYINPLNFFVDAYDYQKDPIGCPKIVRSFISAKELLNSDAYPLLTEEDKKTIITGKENGGWSFFGSKNGFTSDIDKDRTDIENIEVLTLYGDYITNDLKVLKNIIATTINGKIANVKYNGVSTNRIIYAAYDIDEETHRGISPLSSVKPVDQLMNRVVDSFVGNLEDVCNPLAIVRKGAINLQQYKEARKRGFLEYADLDGIPQFWQPPLASQYGLNLLNTITEENKNVLGVNNYLIGDTSGAVRTARESSILFQNSNIRMRVETDEFSYGFLLPLFTSFYAFNRELALVLNEPLNNIYTIPDMRVVISTNATQADREAEANRLMQLLSSPIGQMIFSNLTPEQTVLAVRYLMSKFDLTDADNLLELFETEVEENNFTDQTTVSMNENVNNDSSSEI